MCYRGCIKENYEGECTKLGGCIYDTDEEEDEDEEE